MIQIFLDGRPAVPASNSSIKLTSENSYFTKSASYTYEVQLPLDIPQNRAIFGDIDRLDTDKRERRFTCRLVVDNATLLTGSAHITSVTETAVKIQMLGAEASFNYGNKMDGLYVDELDLGNWYLRTWPDGSYWNYLKKEWEYTPDRFSGLTGSSYPVRWRTFDEKVTGHWFATPEAAGRQFYNMNSGKYPWVAVPTENTNCDTLCNRTIFLESERNSALFAPVFGNGAEYYTGFFDDGERRHLFCIQPYLWKMAELVAEASGLSLAPEDNALHTDPFLKRVFIVNTNNFIECNKCLPHWTVNEWWTQIEQTFDLIMDVDYESMSMSLRSRRDAYGEATRICFVDKVVDDFNAEVGDDSMADLSVSNVGFAEFDADPYDLLSEYINLNASVDTEFPDYASLLEWGRAKGAQYLQSNAKHTLFRTGDGRTFIYMSECFGAGSAPGFREVDQFRPRMADPAKGDVDIELKFVPARWNTREFLYFLMRKGHPSETESGSVSVPVLSVPGSDQQAEATDTGEPSIDIEAVIKEEEEERSSPTESQDLVYIALAQSEPGRIHQNVRVDDGSTALAEFMTYEPLTRQALTLPLSGEVDGALPAYRFSLSLVPVDGVVNLASATVGGGAVVDTRMRHCIKFLYDDGMPDPRALFVIRNRRFVCEKIEADITPDGLSPLYTGYFFPAEL